MSFDLEAFKSKLEELKSSVAYTETGEICPDVYKVRSALLQIKETLPILMGQLRFSAAEFVRMRENGVDMEEVNAVLQDAHVFMQRLNDKLKELHDAAIHKLNSQ